MQTVVPPLRRSRRGVGVAIAIAACCAVAAALVAPSVRAQEADAPSFSVLSAGWVRRVAAGPDGSVVGAGVTNDPDLPGTLEVPQDDAAWRCFVSAWTRDGRLRWTAYPPFARGSHRPEVRGLRVADDGSVWIAYRSYRMNGPGVDEEVGVARFAGDGSLLFATQFGGSGDDRPAGLVLTPDGDAIVAGTTESGDFPVTAVFPPEPLGGSSDGFVARVAGDGSGVVWARRLGGADADAATALCGGAGGVLVAHSSFDEPAYSYDDHEDLDRFHRLRGVDVTQFGFDGTDGWTEPVPRGDRGGVFSLAERPDGTVLVAGLAAYDRPPYGADAFVLRLMPGTGAVDVSWKDRSDWPARVAVEASGDVLVGTDPEYVDPYTAYWAHPKTENTSRVRRLTSDLLETATLLDRDGLRSVEDVAVAPDGAVCVVGHGLGITFNPFVPATSAYDTFVARIPASGVAPPSAVDVGRTAEHTVELSWEGGDPAAGYEVEQLFGSAPTRDLRYTVVARAPAGARGVVVAGLDPGESCRFRLVSVFPSGVRMATSPFVAHTKPSPLSALRAAPTIGGVVVRWSPRHLASNVRLQLERRIGDGPWRRVRRPRHPRRDLAGAHGRVVDRLVPWDVASVTYRLRAVLVEGRGESAWTYSNTVEMP